jgi:hypothetical protein
MARATVANAHFGEPGQARTRTQPSVKVKVEMPWKLFSFFSFPRQAEPTTKSKRQKCMTIRFGQV